MICDYGCGTKASKTLKNGKHCCSNSSSSCPAMKTKNSERVKAKRAMMGDSYWKNGHPKGNSGGSALKGKTYEDIYGTDALLHRAVRSSSNKGNDSYSRLTPQQKSEQEKISLLGTNQDGCRRQEDAPRYNTHLLSPALFG